MSRNLKYLAIYAAYREWRWNRHQTIREQRLHPKPSTDFGYPTCWATGIIFSVLSLPIAVALLAWPGWGYYLDIQWYVIGWTIVAFMIRARYREKHA